jgi:hypothetical protein
MKLIVDEDVAKVAEFMSRNLPVHKFQKIARGLVQLCELIYPEEYPWQDAPYFTFRLERQAFIAADESRQQQAATSPAPSGRQDANPQAHVVRTEHERENGPEVQG